ncbi:MAG: hypothetical protein M1822_001844 [Bathelium mastoideum]|nr:MAG: hypothetical protein M1822_001844 [Bathelium mastoideum]
MPYFDTSQQWLEQSRLLIEARPTTTRVTTKWTLPKPASSTSRTRRRKPSEAATTSNAAQSATLVLKTYDPVSGVTLKYRTDQAAEVGRLVAIMGRLGRTMAGLPDEEIKDDTVVAEAAVGEQGPGTNTPVPEAGSGEAKGGPGPSGGGQGGGGKKKKKGKK